MPSSDFVDDPRCEDDTPSQQLLSEAATSKNLFAANEKPTCSLCQLNFEVPCTLQTNKEPCLTSKLSRKAILIELHQARTPPSAFVTSCQCQFYSQKGNRREESEILTGTPCKKKLAHKKISKKTKSKKKLNYQKKTT